MKKKIMVFVGNTGRSIRICSVNKQKVVDIFDRKKRLALLLESFQLLQFPKRQKDDTLEDLDNIAEDGQSYKVGDRIECDFEGNNVFVNGEVIR